MSKQAPITELRQRTSALSAELFNALRINMVRGYELPPSLIKDLTDSAVIIDLLAEDVEKCLSRRK